MKYRTYIVICGIGGLLVYTYFMRKNSKKMSPLFSSQVKIPDSCVGLIIGSDGHALNLLQCTYNVYVVVETSIEGSSLTISGQKNDVYRAELSVREVLFQKGESKPASRSFPSHLIGGFIGKKACNLKSIREKSNARVVITDNVSRDPETGQFLTELLVYGMQSEVDAAFSLIEECEKKESSAFRSRLRLSTCCRLRIGKKWTDARLTAVFDDKNVGLQFVNLDHEKLEDIENKLVSGLPLYFDPYGRYFVEQLVACNDDGQWKRGQIVSVCSRVLYRVELLDYGTIKEFFADQLQEVDDALFSPPFFGITCRFDTQHSLVRGTLADFVGKVIKVRASEANDNNIQCPSIDISIL